MSITHIPFYPSDWLGGTRSLTAEECGVYINLLATMYEMAGPIERVDERLYRSCGCRSKASFQKALKHLVHEGKITVQGNHLFNDKAQEVIQKVIEKSSSAKASAQARWDKKPNKSNDADNANASQTHMRNECYPKPKPYKKEDTNVSLSSDADIQTAFEAYNDSAKEVGWPIAQVLSKKRKTGIRLRLIDAGGIDGWRTALAKARASPLCCGDNNRNWTADLDFLLQQKSFTRLMEGSYDKRTNGTPNIHGRGAGAEAGQRSDPALEQIARLAGLG